MAYKELFCTNKFLKGDFFMKAIIYEKYGTTDELELNEIDIPYPQNNEVLVKVHAVSVNSWDWDLLRGKPFLTRLGGMIKPKHRILGADISGRVEAVGSHVKHLVAGDEVFGDISWCGWGGFAEYVCVHEDAMSIKPASMTFDQAAAIPQAAVLALQGLRIGRQNTKRQTVLINGAGGGVGTFALQLAKLHGAEVTCVDSTQKLNMLKSLGANYVIDYKKEDFTQLDKSYDLILDVVGTRYIFNCKRVLNPNGTYVMVGGSLSLIIQLLCLGPLFAKTENKTLKVLVHKPNKKDQDALTKLYMEGNLLPVIDRRYNLNQVKEAIRYLGEGHAKGKIIVSVVDNFQT